MIPYLRATVKSNLLEYYFSFPCRRIYFVYSRVAVFRRITLLERATPSFPLIILTHVYADVNYKCSVKRGRGHYICCIKSLERVNRKDGTPMWADQKTGNIGTLSNTTPQVLSRGR